MLCGQLPFENQFSTRWQLMRRLNFRDLIRAQRKEERTQSDLKWRDVIKFLVFFGSYWWLRLVCCLGSLADRTSMDCGNISKNLTITAPTRTWPLSPAPTSPPPPLPVSPPQPQGSPGPSPSSSHSQPLTISSPTTPPPSHQHMSRRQHPPYVWMRALWVSLPSRSFWQLWLNILFVLFCF